MENKNKKLEHEEQEIKPTEYRDTRTEQRHSAIAFQPKIMAAEVMDPVVQPSNVSVRNEEGITEMQQGVPCEQTIKLQRLENDYESEFISCLLSRNRDEITEMEQDDPREQTQKFQSHKHNESVDWEDDRVLAENKMSLQEQLSKCETMGDWLKILLNQIDKNRQDNADDPRYMPLYRAIVEKDWKAVKDFIKENPEASYAKFAEFSQTFFQLILGLIDHDETILLVKEILPFVPKDSLLEKDGFGNTVLITAAVDGNTEAIKLIASHQPDLPNINDCFNCFPIHFAAEFGHKETVLYLLSVTSDGDPSPFAGESGAYLLELLIKSNLYGIALGLLKRYSNLGLETKYRKRLLKILSRRPLGFASGNRFGFWQRLIYHCIPVKEEHIPSFQTNGNESVDVHMDADMENLIGRSKIHPTKSTTFIFLRYIRQIATTFGAFRNQELHTMLWNALMRLAPSIKNMHDTKLSNMQTVELVRMICANNDIWRYKEASEILKEPVLRAARLGISEIVAEIIKVYRYSYLIVDQEGNNIFHLAVLHRREKVLNLMYKIGPLKPWVSVTDESRNNILHLAGKSVPSSQLAGAALQMQRELQWFQAVQNLVHPSLREAENSSNKTPKEVFAEEHEKLIEKGEKWMKDTAQSCSVVAALIITVVFAAAFIVPGGSDTRGVPNFLHEPSFLIFTISDAFALFTSTISVLMFLGILTSHYSQEDFLESLPKKLIIGFIALFLSLASMMITFGAVIYMTISDLWSPVFIPIAVLACVTVTIFARLQFPLLLEMILCTYGPSIFQPKK